MTATLERLSAVLADRYRVERELGAGGMATVFLAHDLRHDRKVALKVLRAELAVVLGADRFVVEIRTTAQLQHPHILPLFDSGVADSFLYYVMPYVEGETLRAKLNRERQLGIDEALRIATEVADALDYAHRHGVIHRDIKPENILLHDGRPMVADFGIALAVSAAAGGRMTETGLSLGTPHYMSPEQATADREITGRSDTYSLATVLYEMLTGDPPHTGASAQQIIMKIVTDAPRPVMELRKAVPPNVAAAMAKALEKLPADRFESAKAFGDALVTPGFTHASTLSRPAAAAKAAQRLGLWGAWAVAATVATLAVIGWLQRPPAALPLRLDVGLGPLTPVGGDIAISPDGTMLALTGTIGNDRGIYVRRLDGDRAFRKVPGTDNGVHPAFSPDNQWIVFANAPARTLHKASVAGAGALTLLTAGTSGSAHWGTDDHIVVGTLTGSYRLPATGGPPEFLEKVTGWSPFLLPDGSGILFSDGGALALYEFAGDTVFHLGARGEHPVLLGTDVLVYENNDGALTAIKFDRRGRRVTGAPVMLAGQVGSFATARGYSLSRNGTLVLHDLPGIALRGANMNRLLMVTRAGATDTLRLPPGRRGRPRFSPDGRTLAFEQAERTVFRTQIYTFDLGIGTVRQLTVEGDNNHPVWSPDGARVLFSRIPDQAVAGLSVRGANAEWGLFLKPADNSGPERPVLPDVMRAHWVSEDLVVVQRRIQQQDDLMLWSPSKDTVVTPYLNAPWPEYDISVSPDRRLAAFISRERGKPDVWLRDFPVPQGKWRVSDSQDPRAPRWSSDGRHLFYWAAASATDTLYRVRVERSPAVTISTREVIYVGDVDLSRDWDLHPDGRRFVVLVADPSEPGTGSAAPNQPRVVITVNLVGELRRHLDGTRR